ncbi:hypothetical protein KAR34_01080 [bacterium]|nr:hypothetical protein [bacterium]
MKFSILKSLPIFTFVALLAVPSWAVRPIEDLRTSTKVEASVVEKVMDYATATTGGEVREAKVARIQELMQLDELNQENTMREALRAEGMEERVQGHKDLELAMTEKNVDLHLGKVLTDMNGNRVRMEEYVMRPEPNQVRFLNLTIRDNRLDHANYHAYFNDVVPRDTKYIFKKWFNNQIPDIYLTKESVEYSNMMDKVNYVVEYHEPTWVEHAITENLTYQGYALTEAFAGTEINGIRKAYHENVDPANTQYEWKGFATIENSIINNNRLATRVKYTFDDGTWFQIDDYLIGENGSLRQLRTDSWENFHNDYTTLLEDITALVFNTYKERVFTASEFGERNIDIVSQFLHLVDVYENRAERPWR